MNVQNGRQARILACLVAAVAVAFTWAGAMAPAWSAARAIAAGIRPPGTGDSSASGAVRLAGSWGRAIEVPGLAALNTGGNAEVTSVSCASAGTCAAGGFYRVHRRHLQGFVVNDKNGVWGRAIEVPGLGALNRGGNAAVSSVSCGSAGSCAAGGAYRDGRGRRQGFVAVERNGRWGRAIEVPGLGALNTGGYALVLSVSCASAGNCAAGGSYHRRDHRLAFVVVERNGRWGTAIEVPGLEALNAGGVAEVSSVSCASAGNCAAAGDYSDGRGHLQGFVASQRNGVWGRAIEVPGLGALNKSGIAGVTSVSCASAGNCTAGGNYLDRRSIAQGFVASQRNGVWGTAIEVPGLRALNANVGLAGGVTSVSCASAGNCAAGGDYTDRRDSAQGFVAVERNGIWGTAIEVPGLGALNKGDAGVTSVACAPAVNCVAGGAYRSIGGPQGFVASGRNGVWGTAIEVPGLGALNKGDAGVTSVACAPVGGCAAGGAYADASGHSQGFVVSQTG